MGARVRVDAPMRVAEEGTKMSKRENALHSHYGGGEVRYESGEVDRENWEVCRESWEVRSKNREVGSKRRGISKETPLLF